MKKTKKSVFERFTGKTIGKVQKERTELLNNKSRGLREAVNELNNKEKSKSRGVEREM